MTASASVASRILSPRRVLAGAGNPDALENVNGQPLPDGAMCWVTGESAWYTFEKFSEASPSGSSIIATVQGTSVPGRWSVVAGGAGSGGTQYLFWESSPGIDEGFMLPWQSFQIEDGSTNNPDAGAIPAPFDGVASLATMKGSATTGVDVVHTVFKNGVATAIVVTVPTGQTLAVDDTHTFEFARGDFLAVQITSGGAGGNYWKFALGITPLP